jgi:AraC family transcriptional regulator of adaptative response / DNA-3-methyladenine glycosylase II
MTSRLPDRDACLRAVASRDRRFDGVFYTAVSSTGIYCRPSCPARTPLPGNTAFYPSAAAAQSAGYRACRRCLPDATPGSPHWDVAADAAGRAMRLISNARASPAWHGGWATPRGTSTGCSSPNSAPVRSRWPGHVGPRPPAA